MIIKGITEFLSLKKTEIFSSDKSLNNIYIKLNEFYNDKEKISHTNANVTIKDNQIIISRFPKWGYSAFSLYSIIYKVSKNNFEINTSINKHVKLIFYIIAGLFFLLNLFFSSNSFFLLNKRYIIFLLLFLYVFYSSNSSNKKIINILSKAPE